MKKVLAVVAALLLTSSTVALACHGPECGPGKTVTQDGWAKSVNGQGQFQGGVGDAGNNWIVGAGGGAQGNFGFGKTSRDVGNKAWDSQVQEQSTFGNLSQPNGQGGIGFSSYQYEEGGGEAKATKFRGKVYGGDYKYYGGQAQVGVAGAINDGKGQAGFGGQGYVGFGKNYAEAGIGSKANQAQNQEYESYYWQNNVGPTGYTYVEGTQKVKTYNGVEARDGGKAASGVGVIQAGGSVALNNGQGTLMGGASASGAYGKATATSDKCSSAKAGYEATQTNSYEQYSASGNSWQGQSGTTGTYIKGGVKN